MRFDALMYFTFQSGYIQIACKVGRVVYAERFTFQSGYIQIVSNPFR